MNGLGLLNGKIIWYYCLKFVKWLLKCKKFDYKLVLIFNKIF